MSDRFFLHDYVIAYTDTMNWTSSHDMVEYIYDGDWKLKERGYTMLNYWYPHNPVETKWVYNDEE